MIKGKGAMKGEMDRRIIYGNKDFIDVIKRGYELEALVKPKGRPKKGRDKNGTGPFYSQERARHNLRGFSI
jgi:hypothetical protein